MSGSAALQIVVNLTSMSVFSCSFGLDQLFLFRDPPSPVPKCQAALLEWLLPRVLALR